MEPNNETAGLWDRVRALVFSSSNVSDTADQPAATTSRRNSRSSSKSGRSRAESRKSRKSSTSSKPSRLRRFSRRFSITRALAKRQSRENVYNTATPEGFQQRQRMMREHEEKSRKLAAQQQRKYRLSLGNLHIKLALHNREFERKYRENAMEAKRRASLVRLPAGEFKGMGRSLRSRSRSKSSSSKKSKQYTPSEAGSSTTSDTMSAFSRRSGSGRKKGASTLGSLTSASIHSSGESVSRLDDCEEDDEEDATTTKWIKAITSAFARSNEVETKEPNNTEASAFDTPSPWYKGWGYFNQGAMVSNDLESQRGEVVVAAVPRIESSRSRTSSRSSRRSRRSGSSSSVKGSRTRNERSRRQSPDNRGNSHRRTRSLSSSSTSSSSRRHRSLENTRDTTRTGHFSPSMYQIIRSNSSRRRNSSTH